MNNENKKRKVVMSFKKEIFKEIMNELGFENSTPIKYSESDNYLGKICMFRTYSAGVHFGLLKGRNAKECDVAESQRVYSWKGACSLSQLATEGSKDRDSCQISVAVDRILLTEVIEIIIMTDVAIQNLKEGLIWKK